MQGAELRGRALSRHHVHLAVPETCGPAVGQVFVEGADALLPHPLAVLVAEEPRALEEVFVVGVDAAAHVAGPADPRAGLDVDLLAYQADLRAPLVELDHGVLGLVVEDRIAGELREGAEFEQQRADLRRVRARAGGLARPQVDEHVGHAGR